MLFLYLRPAISEPVVAEPYISGKIDIDDTFYFLALFTRGFYKAVEEISGPEEVIDDFSILNSECVSITLKLHKNRRHYLAYWGILASCGHLAKYLGGKPIVLVG